jgi:hypothetical protein
VLFYRYKFNTYRDAMLNVKDHKTIYMFDPFEYLGPKRRQLLNDSWAGIFRDYIRQILPVGLLAEYYSVNMGRPTNLFPWWARCCCNICMI